jgi:hypothetical protein
MPYGLDAGAGTGATVLFSFSLLGVIKVTGSARLSTAKQTV